MYRAAFTCILVVLLLHSECLAQQTVGGVELAIYPQAAPVIKTSVRLLPDAAEIVDGNAAVVLMRLPYDEEAYIGSLMKDLNELLDTPLGDPKLDKFFKSYPFEEDMRRAARMSDANWEFALHETLPADVRLKELPKLGISILGHSMYLRIGCQIHTKEYDQALKNLQAQLACARHIGRTPFLAAQFIENISCKLAMQRLELWSESKDSPNLYWALSMLPEPFIETRETWDWELSMLPNSLPSLRKQVWPEVGSSRWKSVAQEYAKLMSEQVEQSVSKEDAIKLQEKLVVLGKSELRSKYGFDKETIERMSQEEITMRWMLKEYESIQSDIVANVSMEPMQALPRLLEIDQRVAKQNELLGSLKLPYFEGASFCYLMPYNITRNVRQLQIVESIRHHLKTHDGKLPGSLDELELPAPLDPITNRSFEYEVNAGVATLKTPIVSGFEEQTKRLHREYVITVAK